MKVALILTHDCDLRCTYCYVGRKLGIAMDRSTAEAAIRFGFAHSAAHADFTFFGGEPLLELETLLHAVDYAEAYRRDHCPGKSARYFTTTNGTRLTAAAIDELSARGVRVTLSLDGDGAGHDLTRRTPAGGGSFDRIAANFPAILEKLPGIDLLMTYRPENLPLLAAGVAGLAARGFRNFFLGADHEAAWDGASLDLLRAQYGELGAFWRARLLAGEPVYLDRIDGKILTRLRADAETCSCCTRGEGEIAVAPSGRLYPCLRFVKEDRDRSEAIGTLESGIDLRRRARILAESSREPGECRACALRARCFHHCGAMNFRTTGVRGRPPASLCFEERAAIETADRLAEELYAAKNPEFMRRFYII